MANEKGVWRTIGGRRVFIKEGQDLASAMKESGKFKSAKKVSKKDESEESDLDKVKRIQSDLDKKGDKLTKEEKAWKEQLANTQKELESGKSREDIIKDLDREALRNTEKDKVLEDFKNSDGSKENFEKALNKISEMEYENKINPDEYKESISKIQKEYVEKNRKASEPIEKRLEKQNRYTESESIKEVKDKYMPERTKAVSQYQNGEIDRNELMKRFDGNEQRMKETFEQMGYTAPTKENIDNANKRHEEFMNNLKGNKEKTSSDTDLNKFNDKAKAKFGKIDYNGTGRKVNEVEIEMELKDGVFSASGAIKNARGTDWLSGGQNIDEIADMMKGNKDVQEIRDLWHKYHLNDMHAGTEKQEEALEKKFGGVNANKYDEQVEYLKSIDLYEDNGYRFGSGWLKREIPDDDKRRIISLIDKYNGKNTNTETSNKTTNQSMNDTLRNAFNDYRKKHKNSNMSFTEFMRINKK